MSYQHIWDRWESQNQEISVRRSGLRRRAHTASWIKSGNCGRCCDIEWRKKQQTQESVNSNTTCNCSLSPLVEMHCSSHDGHTGNYQKGHSSKFFPTVWELFRIHVDILEERSLLWLLYLMFSLFAFVHVYYPWSRKKGRTCVLIGFILCFVFLYVG